MLIEITQTEEFIEIYKESKNYLESIINDAGRYMNDKRPGRKGRTSK